MTKKKEPGEKKARKDKKTTQAEGGAKGQQTGNRGEGFHEFSDGQAWERGEGCETEPDTSGQDD